MSGARWRRQGLVFSGVVLSISFLWLALRQIDGAGVRAAVSSVRHGALLGCAAFIALGVLLRSVRWRTIAGRPLSEQRHYYRATALGVFSNLIFPARAGEFVRVITLAKSARVSLPGPMASALIDRLVDVFVLLLSAAVIYWLSPIGALLGHWIFYVTLSTGTLALLVGLHARGSLRGEALAGRLLNRWLQRWPLRPELFLTELRAEFRQLIPALFSLKLAALATSILCLDYAAIAVLLYAFRLELPPVAPLVLWVFWAAGSALPSAPGYVGIYQVAAVWALSFFAVTASVAVATATILQLTVLAVALLMAGPGAWRICRRALSTAS